MDELDELDESNISSISSTSMTTSAVAGKEEQAGAELGQAQLKLELELRFTSFRICCKKWIKLFKLCKIEWSNIAHYTIKFKLKIIGIRHFWKTS